MKTKRFEQKSRVKVQVRNCSLLFNVASSLALLTGHRLSMASMGGDNSTLNVVGKEEAGAPDVGYEDPGDFPIKLPAYWSTTEGIHLIPDPTKLTTMQELLNSTWRVKYTRDRKHAETEGKVPRGARVINVLRVENHALFRSYCQRKAAIRMKRKGPCERFEVATQSFGQELESDINEMYLYHGTNPDAAAAIAREDFDMVRVGSAVGTMFGPGIYLAEHATKSDEYAQEGEGIFMGQCALLLCRAVAGRVNTVQDKGDTSMLVSSGFYDSVCGDRMAAVGTFREMIFFSPEPVYCEFIIIYSRVFDLESVPSVPSVHPDPAQVPSKPVVPSGPIVPDAAIPLWSHFWDFRGSSEIKDDSSDMKIKLHGAERTPLGLFFNGVNQYAQLDSWTWGNTTSIEVFLAFDKNAEWSKTQSVFDFNHPCHGSNTVHLRRNQQGALGIFQVRREDAGNKYKQIECNDLWQLGEWTHVVCVAEGTTLRLYKNGRLVQSSTNGQPPQVLQRSNHWIGKGDGFFHGTIAYLRIWNGIKLNDNAVSALYKHRDPQRYPPPATPRAPHHGSSKNPNQCCNMM